MIDWLLIVLRPTQEYFTYMETSSLPVKGCRIMSPPSWGRHCFCTFCLSVSLSQNIVLTSPTRRLIVKTWNFVQCFIIISRCAYYQDRRIQLFFYELWWVQKGWGVKYFVLTSTLRWLIIETWNFVQCFIINSRCAYCQDGRIQ
jgi:hypothetical protein